ncbi:MAG: MFS transporter [Rhodoglobus sp.]
MTRVESVVKPAPVRLGANFGRLWTASIASNLADGLGRTAVPLIATTLTTDPLLIAGVAAIAYVPWLFFGLLSGVVVDRVDRRHAMAVANSVRVLAAAGIALAIATGSLTIWLLYAGIVVFGLGETVYDNATTAIIPTLVGKRELEKANSRMQAADLVVQSFIATPIAGLLLAVSIIIPILSTAAGFLVAAVLALTLPLAAGRAPEPDEPLAKTTVRADAKEAAVFLFRHRFLRGMVITTSLIGGLLAFAQATSVLFFLDTMSVPLAAIGFATAGIGIGALAGALAASSLVARFGRSRVMLVSVIVSGLGIGGTGLAPNIWVALVFYAIGAGGVAVWNVPWGALRQDIVPGRLLGRFTGLTRTFVWGLFPVAGVLGGLVARIDLRLPFIVGGALMVLVALCAVRLLLAVDRHSEEASALGSAHTSPQ